MQINCRNLNRFATKLSTLLRSTHIWLFFSLRKSQLFKSQHLSTICDIAFTAVVYFQCYFDIYWEKKWNFFFRPIFQIKCCNVWGWLSRTQKIEKKNDSAISFRFVWIWWLSFYMISCGVWSSLYFPNCVMRFVEEKQRPNLTKWILYEENRAVSTKITK